MALQIKTDIIFSPAVPDFHSLFVICFDHLSSTGLPASTSTGRLLGSSLRLCDSPHATTQENCNYFHFSPRINLLMQIAALFSPPTRCARVGKL